MILRLPPNRRHNKHQLGIHKEGYSTKKNKPPEQQINP